MTVTTRQKRVGSKLMIDPVLIINLQKCGPSLDMDRCEELNNHSVQFKDDLARDKIAIYLITTTIHNLNCFSFLDFDTPCRLWLDLK